MLVILRLGMFTTCMGVGVQASVAQCTNYKSRMAAMTQCHATPVHYMSLGHLAQCTDRFEINDLSVQDEGRIIHACQFYEIERHELRVP